MTTELVIQLLSNHRQAHRNELPQSLTFHTILTLTQHYFSPQQEDMATAVQIALDELQAMGEILAGRGNKFCMAPPTVLAESESNLTGVLFQGDRAYLPLAHQALETSQPVNQTQLRPKIHGFYRIKERLQHFGIRLLTVTEQIEHLPLPQQPNPHLLTDAIWPEDPFQTLSQLMQYIPQAWRSQRERWQPIERPDQRSSQLLRLSTGEYLWVEADQTDQFYELSPDNASLAMFWLDQQARLPLRVPWDEQPGRLNLQGIVLPSAYAQWLWRLSEPDSSQPRTRLFSLSQRVSVCPILKRLGCLIV